MRNLSTAILVATLMGCGGSPVGEGDLQVQITAPNSRSVWMARGEIRAVVIGASTVAIAMVHCGVAELGPLTLLEVAEGEYDLIFNIPEGWVGEVCSHCYAEIVIGGESFRSPTFTVCPRPIPID